MTTLEYDRGYIDGWEASRKHPGLWWRLRDWWRSRKRERIRGGP